MPRRYAQGALSRDRNPWVIKVARSALLGAHRQPENEPREVKYLELHEYESEQQGRLIYRPINQLRLWLPGFLHRGYAYLREK